MFTDLRTVKRARRLLPSSRLFKISLAFALIAAGCGKRTDGEPVEGKVSWHGGNLSGNHVEVALKRDQAARGFGIIDSGGRFKLERLVRGEPAKGLPPGEYAVRLLLDGDEAAQTPKPRVPKRYLDFKTSGWSIQVPTAQEIVLSLPTK